MQLAFSYPLDLAPKEAAQAVPEGLGVIRIDLDGLSPYVGQARNLRRRIARLQGIFADRIARVAYQPVGSSFEARVVLWGAARDAWPQDYRQKLRLRSAVLVKTLQSNRFPRLTVTSRIRGSGLYYGPFRSRVFAEHFEEGLLDFFQVRRCAENLEPSIEHPGCVFGEIGKCMRPCQQAIADEEYRAEFGRLLQALESGGESLAGALEQQRNTASEQLRFELAKGLHEKAVAARKLFLTSPEAADLDRWHGLIVQKGAARSSIALLPVYGGCLQ
jgi:excinuclease UvrABC nuclease subunit